MTKFDVLKWGVQHIATNHGFEYMNEEDGEHCFTICGNNIPTLADVKMMCCDLDISYESIYYNDFGIDIFFGEWNCEQGNEEFESTGFEMWKRFGVEIGS